MQSMVELGGNPFIPRIFQTFDTDGDGKVSRGDAAIDRVILAARPYADPRPLPKPLPLQITSRPKPYTLNLRQTCSLNTPCYSSSCC